MQLEDTFMTTGPIPFERHLSYALEAAHRSVSNSLAGRLKKHGISVTAWRVMECLDSDERLTMGALARRALINPPALSKLVDRMVSDGLVHRQISTVDQRQVNLLLTPLGRRRMLQIREDAEEQDRVLSALLEAEGGEMLKQLLFKLA
jgi:DNA-binding MarR family transcriptional regulator